MICVPKGIKGSGVSREAVETALRAFGTLRQAGVALGIGDNIYPVAARLGVRAVLADPLAMSAWKKKVDDAAVEALMLVGENNSSIAKRFGVHPSTITRSLRRSSPQPRQ